MVTIDQALDTIMQLPEEQFEMFLDILKHRHIENRRQEIASDAKESLALYRSGQLKAQSAQKAIKELRESLLESTE